jgi:Zn-dependent protease
VNFLEGSFQIGRLFGINVRVHVLFVIWIAFQMLNAGAGWRDELLFLALLFGIVLVHEFGHCFGARAVGGYAQNILMWPLGGLAYAHAPMRPWPQFVTVACGPLVNVIFCLVSALVLFAGSGGNFIPPLLPWSREPLLVQPFIQPAWFEYALVFYIVNLWLLGFNLMPIYPLDGGQLLHTILWPFLGLRQATITACYVGLMGCGLFVFQWATGERGSMLLFIALFGGFTCWQQLQAARAGLLQEDSPYATYHGPSHDPRPWWKRVLGIRGGGQPRRPVSRPAANPNPGGWERKQEVRVREEAELDRILRKVSDHGMQSLTYVERQTLERITRERQEREREYQRETRL